MMKSTDEFYLSKTGAVGACLTALRNIIVSHHEGITETIKYGMPCFCLDKKPLCYLWTDRKTALPYLLFVDGKLMDHPELEQGKRSKMKVFQVDPEADLPMELISMLLNTAIDLKQDRV